MSEAHVYITIQVMGSVVSDSQLIDKVHQGLLKKKRLKRPFADLAVDIPDDVKRKEET